MISLTVAQLLRVAAATFVVTDPSDTINPLWWTSDNELVADYSVPFISSQLIPNVAPHVWSGVHITEEHKLLRVDANDSSVVIVTDGSTASFKYDTFIKYGYSSNLLEASFYGVNAAVWIGNASTAYISDSNVTVHNGAANIYAYGTRTVVYVDDSWLYSSGPVSHGLYAAGNGTIYGKNLEHYSGGMRSSAFSGDNPAGYIHVTDSVAHTDGIGSAICYALGLCNITNVIGHTSHAPTMFMDSNQEGIWTNCDLTAGLLAGMVMFSSQVRATGASLTLDHTKLTVTGPTMASLWFGNTIASATVISSELNNTASGILVIANTSQVTQDFDYFAGSEQNPGILPAEVTLNIHESTLSGDLIAYNGSSIDFSLQDYSSWSGKTQWGYETAYISVRLDATSSWTLTGDAKLDVFTDTDKLLSNVFSNGHTVYYNKTGAANAWLNGKVVGLHGGGKAVPF